MSIPTISITTKGAWIKIFIGDLLHVTFNRHRLIGIQTWIQGDDDKYCVEFTFRGGATILSEYNTRDKWESVIKAIDGAQL